MPSNPTGKLASPQLRDWLEDAGDGTVSVLIEPDIPRSAIKVTPRTPGQSRSWQFEEPPAAETGTTDIVKDLKVWLADLLSVEPQWIPSSKVFVGSVDSAQLRRLMESPLVRAIHLNSRHV